MALASTYCLVIDLDLPKELYKLFHKTAQNSLWVIRGPEGSRGRDLFNCLQLVRIGFHGKPHVDLFMQNKFIKNNNTSRDRKTFLNCAKNK